MSEFVVDPESLLAVSRSLHTLSTTLKGLGSDWQVYPSSELGGQPIGGALEGFNDEWMYGVSKVSDDVTTMMGRLIAAAQAYTRIDQTVAGAADDQPVGAGPALGSSHNIPVERVHGGPAKRTHPVHHTPEHHPKHHPKHHGTHSGPTTVGGPGGPGRPGPTGPGATIGSGSGAPPAQHKKHDPDHGRGHGTTSIGGGSGHGTTSAGGHAHDGRGSGTVVIGPGGTHWTVVNLGGGRGHSTTTIEFRLPPDSPAASGTQLHVDSPLLSADQASFVGTLSSVTGLHPQVLAAWATAQPHGADHNLLGLAGDPGHAGAWSDPASAAGHASRFLQGEWGHGGPAIFAARGGTPGQQLAAIAHSGHVADPGALHAGYARLSSMTVTEIR